MELNQCRPPTFSPVCEGGAAPTVHQLVESQVIENKDFDSAAKSDEENNKSWISRPNHM
jgi:hypothetical protein